MIDYEVFYKKKYAVGHLPTDRSWDLFVSAYNADDRVNQVFQNVVASEKHWLIFPEYRYSEDEYPDGKTFSLSDEGEIAVLQSYLNQITVDLTKIRICVDITGFMRPHLLFLLWCFMQKGVKQFDVLYAEPSYYTDREKTDFSVGAVNEPRQVSGFEGIHNTDTTNDFLIIGSGYDDRLIARAAESKNNARKVQVFGLPSLRPDMYQENVLRANQAVEAVGVGAGDEPNNFFAPAYDPFVTASVLREIVNRNHARKPITNLYLCPLATKAQTLGFALYFLTERQNTATSVIYPFTDTYSRETSKGVARVWQYTVELPALDSTRNGL